MLLGEIFTWKLKNDMHGGEVLEIEYEGLKIVGKRVTLWSQGNISLLW